LINKEKALELVTDACNETAGYNKFMTIVEHQGQFWKVNVEAMHAHNTTLFDHEYICEMKEACDDDCQRVDGEIV